MCIGLRKSFMEVFCSPIGKALMIALIQLKTTIFRKKKHSGESRWHLGLYSDPFQSHLLA